jgi:hypothetical protein
MNRSLKLSRSAKLNFSISSFSAFFIAPQPYHDPHCFATTYPLPPNAKLISLNQDGGERVDGREGHVVNFSEGIPQRVITGKTKIQ